MIKQIAMLAFLDHFKDLQRNHFHLEIYVK